MLHTTSSSSHHFVPMHTCMSRYVDVGLLSLCMLACDALLLMWALLNADAQHLREVCPNRHAVALLAVCVHVWKYKDHALEVLGRPVLVRLNLLAEIVGGQSLWRK